MLKIVGEWLAACAYGVVLIGMGLVTLSVGTLWAGLCLAAWLFGLPGRWLTGREESK